MSKSVFVVEDDALTAAQLKIYIEGMGYQFAGKADDAASALDQIRQTRPDLVLMDVLLRGPEDGVELASRLRRDEGASVVYVTAYTDEVLLNRAVATEPYGYLVKPVSREGVQAAIEIALNKRELDQKQERIFEGVVHAINELVKLHDVFLGEVQTRAAELALGIGIEMQLSRRTRQGVRLAAQLHAIGLVAMPIELLLRHKPLTGAAKVHFESHPETAWRLLKDIEFPWPIAEMVRQHRERLDGSGFPHGLSGASILPGARIVAVACAVAERITASGARQAQSVDKVVEALESCKGRSLDADVVDACVRMLRKRGVRSDDGIDVA